MDESIENLRARYSAAPPGGPRSARLAGELGRRLTARYSRDGAGDAERDEAIDLLDEALTEPHDDATVTHVARGTLLFFRAMPIRPGPDPDGAQAAAIAGALMTGALNTPGRLADRDRCLAHMHWVSEHEPPGAPVRNAAEAMMLALELLGTSDPMRIVSALARFGPAAAALGDGPRALLTMLEASVGEAPPERLLPAFDAVLRQLPADHRLRPVLLAEAGAVVARRGPVAELPGTLAGLPAVLAEALDQVRDDHPLRDDTVRKLAGLLLSAGAYTGDLDAATRVVELADRLVAEGGGGRDRFLRGMARMLRGRLTDDPDDLRAAVDDLRAALATLPPGDVLRATAGGMLGVLLNDRHLAQGVRVDADAGAALLAAAHGAADEDDRTVIALAGLMSRAVLAIRDGDRSELDAVIAALEEGLGALDGAYPWRSRLDAALGLALLARGELRRGADRLRRAGADLLVEETGRPVLRAAGAIADLLDGLDGDREALDRAARRIDDAALAAAPGDRAALELLGAEVALARSAPDAVARFERVRVEPLRPGHPLAAHLHAQLALAYRQAGRPDDAVRSGLDALRACGDDVLLQTGTAHALSAARHAGRLMREVVEWAITAGRPEAALEAVELGRGIVLHAAVVAATVPGLLRAAGHPDLAREWESAPAEPAAYEVEPAIAGLVAVPSDLRPRALVALREQRLSSAPGLGDIAAAVRDADADALVYLLAAPGRLLVVSAAGELTVQDADRLRLDAPEVAGYFDAHAERLARADGEDPPRTPGAPTWRGRLAAVCDWAWPALIDPLLTVLGGPARVILVPVGGLGHIPWHAARSGDRYACTEFTFSYTASARHLRTVLGRPRAAGGRTLLLADPTGGLPWASREIEALHATAYPGAAVQPGPDGPGAPDDVLRALADDPAPALLHLACHALTGATPERSHVLLAGPAELPVARILAAGQGRPADAPGGLVVLSACGSDLTLSAYDEAVTLATAFLAAGAVSVVGSRWPVDEGAATACLMVMFHHFRTAGGRSDRDALRAAQRWMLDPDRERPPAVEPVYPRRPRQLADPASWAAFTHHGQ